MTLRELLIEELVAWEWPELRAREYKKHLEKLGDADLMLALSEHIDDRIRNAMIEG